MASDNPYRAPESSNAENLLAPSTVPGGMARITWQTFIALFSAAVISGILVWAMGEENDPLPVSSTLMGFAMLIVVIRWMSYDSRQFDVRVTRYWVLGMICCGLIALPVYFFRTRGWAGWLPTLVALGTLLATSLVEGATVEIIRVLIQPT